MQLQPRFTTRVQFHFVVEITRRGIILFVGNQPTECEKRIASALQVQLLELQF